MKKSSILEFYVFNRLYICIALILVGTVWGFVGNDWTFPSIFIFVGVILLLAHFLLGPIRLLQKSIENGDIQKAQKIIETVKYPSLLIKPIRSVYFMLQSNLAMGQKDFVKAEEMIKKSTKLGMPMKDMDSMAIFQHGAIAFQKGDNKTAIEKLREAISKGISEADTLAQAHLMLTTIFIQRKDNRTAKVHYKKAKEAKPKAKELLDQMKQMDSYISRIPG